MLLLSALGRRKQENQRLKASLNYIEIWDPACPTRDPIKNKTYYMEVLTIYVKYKYISVTYLYKLKPFKLMALEKTDYISNMLI